MRTMKEVHARGGHVWPRPRCPDCRAAAVVVFQYEYTRATGEAVFIHANADVTELVVTVDGSPARTIPIDGVTLEGRLVGALTACTQYERADSERSSQLEGSPDAL